MLKVIAKAWLVLNTNDNSPSAGATIVSPVTSIATPSPAIFSAKTWSGTCDKSIVFPVAGAINFNSFLNNPNIFIFSTYYIKLRNSLPFYI